jgi:hypothetical protein
MESSSPVHQGVNEPIVSSLQGDCQIPGLDASGQDLAILGERVTVGLFPPQGTSLGTLLWDGGSLVNSWLEWTISPIKELGGIGGVSSYEFLRVPIRACLPPVQRYSWVSVLLSDGCLSCFC